MIEAVWQRFAFGGVDAAKGVACDISAISANDSDTGCRKAGVYADDCYHWPFKLVEIFQFVLCNFGFVGLGVLFNQFLQDKARIGFVTQVYKGESLF